MLSYMLSRLRGLACYSISYHAWAVSAEAWVLFNILSRLGSLRQGFAALACYILSRLAVSAEAWLAISYLITPWQYQPRLGILFYVITRLGSIRRGLACYFIYYHALAVSAEAYMLSRLQAWKYPPKVKAPKTRAMKAQVEGTIKDCKSPSSKNPSYESSS